MDSISNLHNNSCNTKSNTIQEALCSNASINSNEQIDLIFKRNNPTSALINDINIYTTPNQAFCKGYKQSEQIFSNEDQIKSSHHQIYEKNKYDNNIIKILKNLKLDQIDLNKFEIINTIYSNSKTMVYLIKDKHTKCLYVAKELLTNEYKDFIRELTILSKLDHPFIVKVIGYSLQNYKQEPSKIIIMEHIKNGSLSRILSEERNQISIEIWNNTMKLIVIYGIAEAISYLHSIGIIHLDLKPENVLINDYIFPILCDFGISMLINCREEDQPPFGGSQPYYSPEVLNKAIRTIKCDSFSFGIFVYVIILKRIPFENHDFYCYQYDVLYKRDKWPKLDESTPEFYRMLIENCWQFDPEKRPTFDDIKKYIRDFKDFNQIGVDGSLLNSFIEFVESTKTRTDSVFKLDERFKKYNLDVLYKEQKDALQNSSSFLSCFSTEEDDDE